MVGFRVLSAFYGSAVPYEESDDPEWMLSHTNLVDFLRKKQLRHGNGGTYGKVPRRTNDSS